MPTHNQGADCPSKDVDLYKDEILDLVDRQHWKQMKARLLLGLPTIKILRLILVRSDVV